MQGQTETPEVAGTEGTGEHAAEPVACGEVEVPCRVVRVHMRCHCGGEYVAGEQMGSQFDERGKVWYHVCNGCRSSTTLPVRYPEVRFLEPDE